MEIHLQMYQILLQLSFRDVLPKGIGGLHSHYIETLTAKQRQIDELIVENDALKHQNALMGLTNTAVQRENKQLAAEVSRLTQTVVRIGGRLLELTTPKRQQFRQIIQCDESHVKKED